jgi:cGMP-dependent protein kinase
MEAYNCFGEICFSKELEVRSATVRASGYVECFIITYDNFKNILDEKLTTHIQKIISLQDYTINLTSLYFIKELGHGKFGKVYLVHNQRNFYAIKSAKIKSVLKSAQLSDYFLREKNIMQQLDHPFIVKFVKTLKDSHYVYFLLEHVDGIVLRNFIEKRKGKELKIEEQARFYGSILFTAIHYLHKKKIIHRDIKPDNCIINSNGYLKLIDFGISKDITNEERTATIVGTPHYIAPEVLHGKGYGYSADYWSIGVVLFEIFYGYYPFGSNSRDVMEIYKNIMEK